MHAKIIACSTMADEIQKVLPVDMELELLPYEWLINSQYANYQRVVFIDTGVEKMESCVAYSKRVADFIKVPHAERQGSLRLLEKMFCGEWDEEFVVTPPGKIVLQLNFL
ncbi:hypothetical protein JCM15765_35760 [Paradesulfitobacterium aromaticivorans]